MADVDFSRILNVLNNAKLQVEQPALYQALKSILTGGAQLQVNVGSQFTSLTNSINNTFTYGLAADKTNYKPQTKVGNLVFYFETDTGNLFVFNPVSNNWQLIGAPTDATYLTFTDESARLPNSRQVVAGIDIILDSSVTHKLKISVELHPFLLMGA